VACCSLWRPKNPVLQMIHWQQIKKTINNFYFLIPNPPLILYHHIIFYSKYCNYDNIQDSWVLSNINSWKVCRHKKLILLRGIQLTHVQRYLGSTV
jgi:hypothetical protein